MSYTKLRHHLNIPSVQDKKCWMISPGCDPDNVCNSTNHTITVVFKTGVRYRYLITRSIFVHVPPFPTARTGSGSFPSRNVRRLVVGQDWLLEYRSSINRTARECRTPLPRSKPRSAFRSIGLNFRSVRFLNRFVQPMHKDDASLIIKKIIVLV